MLLNKEKNATLIIKKVGKLVALGLVWFGLCFVVGFFFPTLITTLRSEVSAKADVIKQSYFSCNKLSIAQMNLKWKVTLTNPLKPTCQQHLGQS